MGNVVISPNIKKMSARINRNGDIIDAKTKQIIERNEVGYIPTPEELAGAVTKVPGGPTGSDTTSNNPLSIQDQIVQAEALLASLKEKKKEQIKAMKKQLAELEK